MKVEEKYELLLEWFIHKARVMNASMSVVFNESENNVLSLMSLGGALEKESLWLAGVDRKLFDEVEGNLQKIMEANKERVDRINEWLKDKQVALDDKKVMFG